MAADVTAAAATAGVDGVAGEPAAPREMVKAGGAEVAEEPSAASVAAEPGAVRRMVKAGAAEEDGLEMTTFEGAAGVVVTPGTETTEAVGVAA